MLMSPRASCYFMALTDQESALLFREEFPTKKDFLKEVKINNRLVKKWGSCAFVRFRI